MGGAVWSIHLLGTNDLAVAYLSSAAFVVGRRSLFDRLLVKLALSTWRETFWRLLEGGSAAAPPRFLLTHRLPCISGLALLEAGGDGWRSWAGLGEAAGGREPSSAALGKPGEGCGPSSAAPGKPGDGCWSSSAALGVWGH
jgi:hypothetical protein